MHKSHNLLNKNNSYNDELISIIMPVYNASKYIQETLTSVLNQSYTNWELILIDDCSTDNSEEIILKYALNDKRLKYIKNETNLGAAKSRNKGIIESAGRYICYLDADDFWDIEKLEKQFNFMKLNNYKFTFTSYMFTDEKGNPTGKPVIVPKSINYNNALKNTTIWTTTVMLDSKLLGKSTILMPEVPSEDTASWWKILKTIDEAHGIQDVLAYYRRSEGTLSSNKFIAIKRIWNLYRNVEHLSLIKSIYCFIHYAIRAVKRRV